MRFSIDPLNSPRLHALAHVTHRAIFSRVFFFVFFLDFLILFPHPVHNPSSPACHPPRPGVANGSTTRGLVFAPLW